MIEDLYYKKNINCSYTLIIIYVKNKIKKFRKMHTKKGALCSNSIDVRSLLVKRVRWRNLTDVYHQTGYLNEKLRDFPFYRYSFLLCMCFIFCFEPIFERTTIQYTICRVNGRYFVFVSYGKWHFQVFSSIFFFPLFTYFVFLFFVSILVFVSTFLLILTHKEKN